MEAELRLVDVLRGNVFSQAERGPDDIDHCESCVHGGCVGPPCNPWSGRNVAAALCWQASGGVGVLRASVCELADVAPTHFAPVATPRNCPPWFRHSPH